MTRLYNHTQYDDALLREVFNFAARMNDIEGDVPVKLTHSRAIRAGGLAHGSYPYRKTLTGKPTTSKDRRTLKCPIGYITMSLPRKLERPWVKPEHSDYKDRDALALEAAEWFVDVAIHEMAHIRQFRTRTATDGHRRDYGKMRRARWASRPCEIDAENAIYEVHENRARNKRRQELALQLAEHLLNMNK